MGRYDPSAAPSPHVHDAACRVYQLVFFMAMTLNRGSGWVVKCACHDKKRFHIISDTCQFSNATLECELLAKRKFKNQREASLAVFDFIEGWYNPHRRHSGLGYLSPNNYEPRMVCVA